jgi:hypothetical protein
MKAQSVARSNIGSNFYTVKTDKGEVIVAATGQVYSIRENLPREEVPQQVTAAIEALFQADKIKNIYRNEWQYYQFNQTTSGGQPVTVWMRPDGDIVKVITPEADDAALAGHTESPNKKNTAKKKPKAQ